MPILGVVKLSVQIFFFYVNCIYIRGFKRLIKPGFSALWLKVVICTYIRNCFIYQHFIVTLTLPLFNHNGLFEIPIQILGCIRNDQHWNKNKQRFSCRAHQTWPILYVPWNWLTKLGQCHLWKAGFFWCHCFLRFCNCLFSWLGVDRFLRFRSHNIKVFYGFCLQRKTTNSVLKNVFTHTKYIWPTRNIVKALTKLLNCKLYKMSMYRCFACLFSLFNSLQKPYIEPIFNALLA